MIKADEGRDFVETVRDMLYSDGAKHLLMTVEAMPSRGKPDDSGARRQRALCSDFRIFKDD